MKPIAYLVRGYPVDENGTVLVLMLATEMTGDIDCSVCLRAIRCGDRVYVWEDDSGAVAHEDCVEVVQR